MNNGDQSDGSTTPSDEGPLEDISLLVADAGPESGHHADRLREEFEEVVEVTTIDAVCDEIRDTQFDCVVTGNDLPDGDGLDLFDVCQQTCPTIPVILWPAAGSDALASQAIRHGVTDYVPRELPESHRYDSLAERVREVAARHRPNTTSRERPTSSEIILEVNAQLVEANTVEEAFYRALEHTCDATAWEYAEVWFPDDERTTLTREISYAKGDRFDSFNEVTDAISFEVGAGLPGRVWGSGTCESIPDVTAVSATEYRRTAAAAAAGLRSAHAIPIRDDSKICAVVSWYSTHRLTRGDGSLQTVEHVGTLLEQQLTDLQGRHRGEDAPAHSSFSPRGVADRVLETLVEHVDVTLWMVTQEFEQVILTSENFERLSGYPREEFHENPERLLELIHPDDRERVEQVWESRSEPYSMEYRVESVDGETVWIEERGRPVEMEPDRTVFVGTAIDITDRKRHEQALQRQRALLRHTEDLAQTGGWTADLATGTQRWTNGTKAIHEVPDDYEPTVDAGIDFFHPEDRDTIQRVFDRCAEAGEPYDVELRIITATGNERWVRATGKPVREDGEITKVSGAIRDITARKQYENVLKELADGTRELLTEETDAEIAHTVVDVGTSILSADGIAVYLYDDEVERLIPTATNDVLDEILEELPRFAPGDSVAWDVFVEQESAHFEDIRTADGIYRSDTPIRSELIQPLGEFGVLLIGDTDIGAFGPMTFEVAEMLAATAKEALTRAKRTAEIRVREQEYHAQANELQDVERLNAQIRSAIKAVVEAGTQESVKQVLCDSLISHEEFTGVWIGEPRHSEGSIEVAASAGALDTYLRSVELDLDSASTVPTARALAEREPVVESNLAENPHQDSWRNPALIQGSRSVASVPIVYDEILYGALSVHSHQPNHFDERTVSVLAELGELIGYILNTVAQRYALQTGGSVELTFDLQSDDTFVEMARELDATIQIHHIIDQSEEASLVYFSVVGSEPRQVIETVDQVSPLRDITLISSEEPPTFEVTTYASCVGTEIRGLGANLRSVSVSESTCELTISVPHDGDIQRIVRHLDERYQNVEVRANDDEQSIAMPGNPMVLHEVLTERQETILRAAFVNGYFDQPRERTGVEIAESLGISQPAFATRLRAAQRNLLTVFLE